MSEPTPAIAKPATANPPDIAAASIPDTLAALRVNPDFGLTLGEIDVRRKEHGYNEVAERKKHPVLKFLGKFWGMSAWMLELIMVLSAILGNYSDLAVVGVSGPRNGPARVGFSKGYVYHFPTRKLMARAIFCRIQIGVR